VLCALKNLGKATEDMGNYFPVVAQSALNHKPNKEKLLWEIIFLYSVWEINFLFFGVEMN
jgi:hypothetical protein